MDSLSNAQRVTQPTGLTSETYAEYLRLTTRGVDRTLEEEQRYRELGSRFGLDGADLTPTKVETLEEKRDSGERLTRAETVALDAAYRRAKPWNRPDRRWSRGRPLADRVFRRRPGAPRRVSTCRQPRGRRVRSSRSTRGSPRPDVDPSHRRVAAAWRAA
jgi:hypothetical protein